MAELRLSGNAGRHAEPLVIRVIEYQIDDGRVNDESYRLFTTILDSDDVSAVDLAVASPRSTTPARFASSCCRVAIPECTKPVDRGTRPATTGARETQDGGRVMQSGPAVERAGDGQGMAGGMLQRRAPATNPLTDAKSRRRVPATTRFCRSTVALGAAERAVKGRTGRRKGVKHRSSTVTHGDSKTAAAGHIASDQQRR